jgi:hypothetical protein
MVNYAGDGRHVVAVDPKTIVIWLKMQVPELFFYFPSVSLPKLSILALYLRIFTTKPYRYGAFFIAGILIAQWIIAWILTGIMCTPFAYLWDKEIPGGHCLDQTRIFTWFSFPNIVTDIMMLLLPLPVVWQLHTSKNQKIGLTITFLTFSV